jgi:hypothetical protein
MFESAFVRNYMREDMFHGVSREFAKKRATLTEKFNNGKFSSQEYHRQMDAIHAAYPEDTQKLLASGNYR